MKLTPQGAGRGTVQAESSVRAHVVLLADLDAVVAQEGVDGGDVKEKLRQSIVGKIGLAAELLFLRRAREQDDLALFAAFELRLLQHMYVVAQIALGKRAQSSKCACLASRACASERAET